MKNLKILILALCLTGSENLLQSQSTLSVSGGNASGQGGSLSYTVGQVAFHTFAGTAGEIMQGIQQPYEITVITGSEIPGINLLFSVYPNPADEFITLETGDYGFGLLYYNFYNINGNVLLNGKVNGDQYRIYMGNLKSGTYFLRLSERSKILKTFKIIKK